MPRHGSRNCLNVDSHLMTCHICKIEKKAKKLEFLDKMMFLHFTKQHNLTAEEANRIINGEYNHTGGELDMVRRYNSNRISRIGTMTMDDLKMN